MSGRVVGEGSTAGSADAIHVVASDLHRNAHSVIPQLVPILAFETDVEGIGIEAVGIDAQTATAGQLISLHASYTGKVGDLQTIGKGADVVA